MTVEQAKTLAAALVEAIRRAEVAGHATVDLQGELSAQLGDALAELKAAIADQR